MYIREGLDPILGFNPLFFGRNIRVFTVNLGIFLRNVLLRVQFIVLEQ